MIPTTDQLETARTLLAVGIALANVAVWYGVSLEREALPAKTKERGWRVLVRALAVEATLALVLVAVDTTISSRLQSEIIALERAAGPRNLIGDEISKLVAALKPLGGQPYDLTRVPMMESGSFLDNQIVGALRDAGWTLKSVKSNGEIAQIPFILFTASQDSESAEKMKILQSDLFDSSRLTDIKIGVTHDIVGVDIVFRNNDFTTPAFSLSSILKDAGIGGGAGWTLDSGMSDDAIHVIIGRK
jgi:hypothetical protein